MKRNDIIRRKIVPFLTKNRILKMVMSARKRKSSMVAKMNIPRHVMSSGWKKTHLTWTSNFKESDIMSKLRITLDCLFTSEKSRGRMTSIKKEKSFKSKHERLWHQMLHRRFSLRSQSIEDLGIQAKRWRVFEMNIKDSRTIRSSQKSFQKCIVDSCNA